MKLDTYLRTRLQEREILLMTHIVLGYPSFEDCSHIIETMVRAGVDLVELQIPFSEPIADGPVIVQANRSALASGVTVQGCLDFAQEVAHAHDIPFLIMSYYNVIFRYGTERFVSTLATRNLQGAITPDLPPEEGEEYLAAMREQELAPILIFSPTTTEGRMEYLASLSSGFVYCVARKGVTGADTRFSDEMTSYLARCRRATNLPLALGFGVRGKRDIDYLRGKSDIAVIGTRVMQIFRDEGLFAVEHFLKSLR